MTVHDLRVLLDRLEGMGRGGDLVCVSCPDASVEGWAGPAYTAPFGVNVADPSYVLLDDTASGDWYDGE